jgi:hypothetical protein
MLCVIYIIWPINLGESSYFVRAGLYNAITNIGADAIVAFIH